MYRKKRNTIYFKKNNNKFKNYLIICYKKLEKVKKKVAFVFFYIMKLIKI